MAATIINSVKSYSILTGISLVLEYFWIRFPARNLYRAALQELPRALPLLLIPLLIYFVYTLLLYVFCAAPAVRTLKRNRGLVAGAICGAAVTALVHLIHSIYTPGISPWFIPADIVWRALAGAMSCGILYYVDGPGSEE